MIRMEVCEDPLDAFMNENNAKMKEMKEQVDI